MWQFIKNLINPVSEYRYEVVELSYIKNRKLFSKQCDVRKHMESGEIEIFTVAKKWVSIEMVFQRKGSHRFIAKISTMFEEGDSSESSDSDDKRQIYLSEVICPIVSGLWVAITSFIVSLSRNDSPTEIRNSLIASE